MTRQTTTAWAEQNRKHLLREFEALRHLGEEPNDLKPMPSESIVPKAAIDTLVTTLGLSAFERKLLLLCAGVEMDPPLAKRCAELLGRPHRGFVTFGLAMAVLPDPHWSAFTPSAPLRRFRLIEMESNQGFTTAPLRIDERILHYIAGVNRIDQRIESMVSERSGSERLSEDQQQLANAIVAAGLSSSSALHFCGDDPSGQENVAAFISHQFGRELYVLRMEDIAVAVAEHDLFVALWAREALLLPAYLLLQWGRETPTPATLKLVRRLSGPLMIASRGPLPLHRPMQLFDVSKASPLGQQQLWESVMGPSKNGLAGKIEQIAEQFRLSADTIAAVGASVKAQGNGDGGHIASRLWSACRTVSRPQLEELAERIEPVAGWSDLVLPLLPMQMLRQLAAQARHRMTVYERWGLASRGRRGLGLSSLFSGPSGTGKTLAAEVLAADLQLDLYRVDLSTVVSKFIGETEKKLSQVFDAAECGGVLLLFDEADALFGKRSEVTDSLDRYANIEVSYLLQRMENFQGLAVLTTNMKSALDRAFLRRLRFVVDFPFPDVTQRLAIWRQIFPDQTPKQGIEPALLANLNVAGGNIRNIAMNAAFMAAEQDCAVQMRHLLAAAQLESIKLERPVSKSEIRDWV